MPNLCITRGTSPTFTFILPNSYSTVSSAIITFAQRRIGYKVEKSLSHCTVSDGKLTLKLGQGETIAFKKGAAEMQIRLGFGGEAYASPIYRIRIRDILSDEVLKL